MVASSMPPIHVHTAEVDGEDPQEGEAPFTVTLVTGVISHAMFVTLNP